LSDDLTIVGRSLDADLILKDGTVAPSHCEIRRSPEGFKVIDLETRAGTTVNGKSVNQHFLKHGDTVQLGDARLTFLGDSANAPKKSRHAPPEPLRALPINSDGEPRRFYRHEKEERIPPVARAAIAVAVLGIVILIIMMLTRTNPRKESVENFRRAKVLVDQGDESSLRLALRILQELPKGDVQELDVQDLVLRAESDLFNLEQDNLREAASLELDRIYALMDVATPNVTLIRSEILFFQERFANDSRIPELQKRLAKIGGGTVDSTDRFNEAHQAVSRALQAQQWKKAFDSLRAMESDGATMQRMPDRVAVLRSTLESRFGAYFAQQQERALSAHGAGRTTDAIAIFQEFLELGQEPFASTARRLLERIK
jgi:hypothetical protein